VAKVLRCKDTGSECDFEARAHTEEELWRQVAEHAEQVHNLQLTDELKEQLRSFIRDEV
jgi:predicted small metal-binding protein